MLFITDGCITDYGKAVDRIVKCSRLPVSIIIIGVGTADFTMMKNMDDDKGKLIDIEGNKPERDCVQFVEYWKCNNDIEKLRREVLMEIPNQIQE
mmetsp:Transcript_45736/g.38544  ORF Transcript_45736/g.38544 Transcript_45736/m.38544 type:complete len:95 (+) Transcript_45736:1278-1562(+)